MQNVDGFKWRNNLNVETNASNASVRKRPKVDKIPTTSKRKKFDSTAPSMEIIKESINIPQAAEEAIFDPLPDSIKENLAVVMEDTTVASPSMEATSTIQESMDTHQAAEEAIFDPLPDVMNENVAVVIDDSTVTSPSMEASSTNFKSNFVTFQSLVTSSMVPKNWTWYFDQIKQTIFCISMDRLPNENYNVKSVHFQNKK
ncbi:uncharacterized protein LOC124209183 [Daphnia pulex]|uniref:uncharacterized protein LOC124188813 n=1 Tax=Daphnia pulex TaxID=6669 RepID=UPI001EDF73F9|nr:uncharacterized protein LOC124188813 [Daphnia pulex]XP_046461060.1 uncharacterized protein LOC124207564 [Daphnia pulex]XP_046461061.1 uncharacterized protein LOC124207564 [Daphnia pulex]XP_046462836.1 uncharacterized protein LOC124209007 [Daphnia pulex]XP_046463043.1 uncharacterized protein LOC124209183 [Daphnia pulex]XP_046463044.1 uncharacterized protein LOC124209183 [Daphnia pulex]